MSAPVGLVAGRRRPWPLPVRALALLIGLGPWPTLAEPDAAALARAAMAELDAASAALREARGARDRVDALTRTVLAYEDGLAATRAGLRAAALREAQLARAFEGQQAEVARLLGALTAIERAPAPLFHPEGPLAAARAGMLLADVAPGLQAEARRLQAGLDRLAELRAVQAAATERLATGRDGAQRARLALAQALADREPLPSRFTATPGALEALAEGAASLDAFARSLAPLTGGAPGPSTAPNGRLPLPAGGRVLRGYREADAAGVRRPGLLLATAPQALVTAPVAGTLRYAGPLLDYGNVMILEPDAHILFVFAGLGTLYGRPGEVVEAGAPLGLMAGNPGTGSPASESLYVEVRNKGTAEDPAIWFATNGG